MSHFNETVEINSEGVDDKMNKERIVKISNLLGKYYDSEDSFEQTDLAIELIQSHMEWLMKQTEKLERVKFEVEERLRNANNLDEYDVSFELANILETLD